jgi:hypothetical protein
MTISLQKWVGDQTLYADTLAKPRIDSHFLIYCNAPADIRKDAHKVNSRFDFTTVSPIMAEEWVVAKRRYNIRIIPVYLVEHAHRATGIPVLSLYKHLDTVSLFLFFIVLFFVLRKWCSASLALAGVLYCGFVFQMTYYYHFFHPWDRLSTLCWLVLIYLIYEKKDWLFAIALVVSVAVKYDVVVLPGLYFLCHVTRENAKPIVLRTVLFFVLGFSTYFGLKLAFEADGATGNNWLLPENVASLKYAYRHPHLLTFALPYLLVIYKVRQRPRFVLMSALFAMPIVGLHFFITNFHEVRAQTMVLVLLLPAALLGLQMLLEDSAEAGTAAAEDETAGAA